MPRKNLTAKQSRFVELYLLTLNASQAALDAGYSPKTAYAMGAENLRKPEIAKAIQLAGQRLSERTQVTQKQLIAEWVKIAFTDLADFMTWGPDGAILKAMEELTPAQRAAVAEVSQTITKDGGTIRLKLHDKQKALSELAARLWPITQQVEGHHAVLVRVVYDEKPALPQGLDVPLSSNGQRNT